MKENKEIKNEKGPDNPLNNSNEQPPIIRTSPYFSEVSNFYSSLINQYSLGTPSEEDYEVVDYFENNKRALQELSREKNKAQPDEVAMAILYLAGNMANNNPFSNKGELLPQNEENYFKSKDLFMKSCEKAFPELVKTDLNNINLPKDFPKLFNNFKELSPKKQLEMIDAITETQVTSESTIAYNMWKDGSDSSEELINWAKEAYKLQLLRDKIQKELYGNVNISSQEVAKIDELKEKLIPKQDAQYEKITEANIEDNVKRQKSILLDGYIYKTLNIGKEGDVFIERPISIKEALALAEKVTKQQSNSTNINSGSVKTKMFSVSKENLMKNAQWVMQAPRLAEDPKRKEDVREAQELQKRIQSGEFEQNYGGSLALLLDVLEQEAKRLNEEKESYSGK